MPIDTEAGTRTWGVPSSVAAHWPGIEQGPAALREGGLLETLRAPEVIADPVAALVVAVGLGAGDRRRLVPSRLAAEC